MIRRKQYLYGPGPVPKMTLHSRKLRKRYINSLGSTSTTVNETQSRQPGNEEITRVAVLEAITKDVGINDDPHTEVAGGSSLVSVTTVLEASQHITKLPREDSEIALLASESNKASIDLDTSCSDGSASEGVGSGSEPDLINEDIVNVSDTDYVLQDEIDDNQSAENEPALNSPLCKCTATTEGDILLMCLALGLRHALSWQAMTDVLSLFNHIYDRKVVTATKDFFLKYMETEKDKMIFHVYCHCCERYLGTKTDVVQKEIMSCPCGTNMKDINQASTYFLSLSLESQIRNLFKNKKFVNFLNYRFIRDKIDPNAYEDIYDGELYRSLSAPGQVLAKPFNISYSFNTDCFPVGGKSGKQTFWPIYVQINELPPKMRSSFMLLAGIYVGRKDPNMKPFLYPFVEEANLLSSKGVNWTLNGKSINSKVIPLCACVDSPARSKLLNMMQFDDWYGCTVCHVKAESTEVGLRYTIPLIGLEERSHEEILVNAAKAAAHRRTVSVQGVKGPSPLHTLEYIDLVRGVRPEIMHSVLLGNGNHHTSLLHDSAGTEYYIGSDLKKNAINERLLKIKPPSSIMRLPQSIHQMSSWKASEWRLWVLFYGVVCLYGIIPDEYVSHFSMLSSGLHIILQNSITAENLERANILLLRYMFMYQKFFGKEAMVYNIHLLFHTKRSIQCLGPAWTHTAFGFESANKSLLQLKRGSGTPSVAKEIAHKYLTFKSLPMLCERYASTEQALKYCENISGRSLKYFQKSENIVLVDNGSFYTLNEEEYDCLQGSMFLCEQAIMSFEKIIISNNRYCVQRYCHSEKTDDSYICIQKETLGRIQRIVSPANDKISVFLLVRELVLSEQPIFTDGYGKQSPIKKVVANGRLVAIRPEDISTQCVAMSTDRGHFICEMPFGCYGDS